MTRNMSEATKISRKEAEGIRKGKRQTSIDEMHPKNSEKTNSKKEKYLSDRWYGLASILK
jgi:hypothetical protein